MNNDDLRHYKVMKAVLNKVDFNVKGEALLLTAASFKWFMDLEPKIVKAIMDMDAQKSIEKAKEVKPPLANAHGVEP